MRTYTEVSYGPDETILFRAAETFFESKADTVSTIAIVHLTDDLSQSLGIMATRAPGGAAADMGKYLTAMAKLTDLALKDPKSAHKLTEAVECLLLIAQREAEADAQT